MTIASRVLLSRSALLGVAFLLYGCGFRPLYATRGGPASPAQQELETIDVARIPERAGQLLRQALQQRFHGADLSMAKRYALSVSFGIAGDAIGIQRDSTPTRLREIATATWSLRRLDVANTLVASGTARAIDGVNIIDQQYFAADLEGEAVQRRISESVADQITLQIASYFAHPASV